MTAPSDAGDVDVAPPFPVGRIVSHSFDERANTIRRTVERHSEGLNTVDTPALSQASSIAGSSDSLATPSESSGSRHGQREADRASHTATHGTASSLAPAESTSSRTAAPPAIFALFPAHVGAQFAQSHMAQEGHAGKRGSKHALGSTALCLDGAAGIDIRGRAIGHLGTYPPDIDSLSADTLTGGVPTPSETGAKAQAGISPDDVIARVGKIRDDLYASRSHARTRG
ncbi:hypothetical protein B0T25DRAFT_512595 [Lasiosphaeria hispida]|uniref:Uncharacterized protein n=1 Tax=Lasiosphaeria hispida TaxID=260671 RepID=A0AAJ0MJ33_9PEZI|nr:hypothetical protein B0T25DRAFT_512595 [Lasiosphaeria hispida]